MWLIGDGKNARREQFEKAGWTIGYHRRGSQGRHGVRLRLSAEQPRLLYIVNLGGMDENEETSNFLSTLMYDQLNLRGLILLEAPEHSSAWTMPHGKKTESTEWYAVTTRWCGLEAGHLTAKGEWTSVKGGSTTPRFSTYVRANFPL